MLADAHTEHLRRTLASFKRVVIWGHPLHTNTFSYVYEAFARAFRWLGANTLWTDDLHALDALNLADTLFICEGQATPGLPIRRDCRYVLHNASYDTYAEVVDRALVLQVHTEDVRERHAAGARLEKLNEYTFFEPREGGPGTLHQPWATDLLPHELNFDVSFPASWPHGRARSWLRARRTGPLSAIWVGTIGAGKFGNVNELEPFRRACAAGGISFVHCGQVDRLEHIRLVQSSLLAPAIVGSWQLEHGYIPCRIFKNISYGRLGITNSPWVQAIFEHELLCQSDTAELFWQATNFVRDRPRLVSQMREVQQRHTYVNRIETILEHLP